MYKTCYGAASRLLRLSVRRRRRGTAGSVALRGLLELLRGPARKPACREAIFATQVKQVLWRHLLTIRAEVAVVLSRHAKATP